MADRVQLNQDLGLNSPLRPVARPTDNYYQVKADTVQLGAAEQVGGGDFADLAHSVGVAAPIIQKTLSEEEKFQQEQAIKEGAKARLVNQKSFKDAVQAGLIKPSENPWFIKGYLQQDGRLSGMSYDEALRTAWSQSAAKNSDNPADFKKFQDDFRTQWIKENDGKTPDWMDGFAPRMQQADNNLVAQHVAHRQQVIEQTLELNTGIEINKLIAQQKDREALAGNDPELIGEGRRATAAQIDAILSDLVKKGLDGKKANNILAEQVFATAIENNDAGLMKDILGNVRTPGGTVADITEVKSGMVQAERTIRANLSAARVEQWAIEDRPDALEAKAHAKLARQHSEEQWKKQAASDNREERVRGLTGDMFNQVNDNGVIDPMKLKQLAKDDWRSAEALIAYQRARLVRREEIITDQSAVARMSERIASNPESVSEHELWAGVTSGTWSEPHARAMSNELQQRMNSPVRGILKNNLDYRNLEASGAAAIAKNMETARTGAGEAEAGLFKIRFRKAAEDIYSDQSLKDYEKVDKLRDVYLKEIQKSNAIAAEFMRPGGPAPETRVPTAAEVAAERKKKQEADAAAVIKAKEDALIPQKHVQTLLDNYNNPEARAEFDKKYGPGASTMVGVGGASQRYPKRR